MDSQGRLGVGPCFLLTSFTGVDFPQTEEKETKRHKFDFLSQPWRPAGPGPLGICGDMLQGLCGPRDERITDAG